MQVGDIVCESFTRPDPDSCSCTLWEKKDLLVSHMLLNIPMYLNSTLRALTKRIYHQAQEKVQKSHLVDLSAAFLRNLSPVWGWNCELPQTVSGL